VADVTASSASTWPRKPVAAFHGIAGDFARLVEPQSEVDPCALLVQLLVAIGSVLGRGPHFVAESDRHFLNLFAVLVGETAKARKGSSWGHVKRLLERIDPEWLKQCLVSGLSSGEGLIYQVRDPVERTIPLKEKGRVQGYQHVVEDKGVSDKRLLVVESEFASTLRVLGRDGNTLSPILRNAWDGAPLRSLTKNSPLTATDGHISIVAHVTRGELLRYLTDTEAGNGFGNRFGYFCVRRSKCLPEGGKVPSDALDAFVARLANVLEFARSVGEMRRDDGARALWHEVYPRLSEGRPGLLGAMTARSEAQVMRLACLYALLDGSQLVGEPHLRAALALWYYAYESAAYIFGDTLGDPVADEIVDLLRGAGEAGATRTEIRDHFGRHRKKDSVERALSLLRELGLAWSRTEETRGRPAERWFLGENEEAAPARLPQTRGFPVRTEP